MYLHLSQDMTILHYWYPIYDEYGDFHDRCIRCGIWAEDLIVPLFCEPTPEHIAEQKEHLKVLSDFFTADNAAKAKRRRGG